MEFSYNGNKISSIKETINTEKYNRYSPQPETLLASLVSEEMYESIEANAAVVAKIQYNQQINQYDIEWDGKDISKVSISQTAAGTTVNSTIEYTYDKNHNPQNSRLMGLIESDAVDYLVCSKHNVISCKYESPSMTYVEENEYTYDKKMPVEKLVKRTETNNLAPNIHSEVEVTEKWSFNYVED